MITLFAACVQRMLQFAVCKTACMVDVAALNIPLSYRSYHNDYNGERSKIMLAWRKFLYLYRYHTFNILK